MTHFTRRRALAGGLALATLPTASFAGTGLPADPAEQNEAYVKILGRTDEGRVTKKTRGIVMAVLPDAVVPLYGFRNSESAWWRKIDDASWVRFPSVLSFFTDLQTDTFIDTFESPFNGETVTLTPSFIRHKEGELFTPNGHYYGSMKRTFPDRYPEKPLQLNWTRDGDDVRLQRSSNFPPMIPQPSLESVSFFSNESEVFDPAVTDAHYRSAGWNIFSGVRAPYQALGVLPGHAIWHFDAVKLDDVDECDADYLKRARAYTPLYDQSPELDEGPSFFERLMSNRQP
ncbi:MAG: DUF1838 domain-containing protein [Alphaproteobacteria bacterium]|nr:DUF1838 domain-containing protein [Alphaproteobacteria bacterium]